MSFDRRPPHYALHTLLAPNHTSRHVRTSPLQDDRRRAAGMDTGPDGLADDARRATIQTDRCLDGPGRQGRA